MAKCLGYGPAGGSGSFELCPWGSILYSLFHPSLSFFLSLSFIHLLGPQVPVTMMFCPNVWGQVTMEQTLWNHKTKPISLILFQVPCRSYAKVVTMSVFQNPERANLTNLSSPPHADVSFCLWQHHLLHSLCWSPGRNARESGKFNWVPDVINQDSFTYTVLVFSTPQILSLPSGS